MTRFRPSDEAELVAIVQQALASEEPLELIAGGSKRGLGRPLQLPHVLDLGAFAGIRDYEPEELVLTAGAATPLAEIEAALDGAASDARFRAGRLARAARHERPRRRPWAARSPATSPGRAASARARRAIISSASTRVSGRGEAFKAGGRVVKNVTGYDLSKLMAGLLRHARGADRDQVKVLPRPEATRTVVLPGLDAGRARARDDAGAQLGRMR